MTVSIMCNLLSIQVFSFNSCFLSLGDEGGDVRGQKQSSIRSNK